MKNQFEWEETIALEDADFTGRMTPEALMRRVQKSTGRYADERGVGIASLQVGKWMIVHALMKIERMPRISEKVKFVFSLGAPVILFPCFLSVYGEGGDMLVGVYSEWCVLNTAGTGLVRPADLGFEPGEHYITPFLPPAPLDGGELPSPAAFVYERKIRISDIDMNRHTNNLRYLAMATDVLSAKEWEALEPRGMELRFLGQSYEGNVLRFFRQDGKNSMLLYALSEEGKEIFRAVLAYAPRGEI